MTSAGTEERLRESEARLELAARASGVGIWDWKLDTNEVVFTSRAKTIWGFPEDAVVTQAMMASAFHSDDVAETNERFRRATDPAIKDREPYQYRILRRDGVRWVRAHAEAVFEERDGREVAIRYVGTMVDVTEEVEREAALRESEARLKLAIEAGRMAVWSIDSASEVVVTPEFNRLLGLAIDARPTLAELQTRYYPGELERLQALAEATLARGERYIEFEYRHLWPDDSVRWLLVRAEFLLDGQGQPIGSIGVVMDITDRHESEERLRLLAREVDHRANNLLATVQGAIALTRGADLASYKQSLLGRVSALANAHQLLANSRWQGADLRRLLEDELRPYSDVGHERVHVEGPDWELSPETAQAIAMVIHELTTNAVKYGALSTPQGRVQVRWSIEGSERVITWLEAGGPEVRPPTRRGMGTEVLARALGGPIGGRTELDWAAGGLRCRVHLPKPL